MEMATTMTMFNYPRVSKLPSKECLGTGAAVLNVAVCFQQNACAFGRRLSYQCSYVQVIEPFLVNYFGTYSGFLSESYMRTAWRIRSSVDDSGLDPSTSGSTRGTRLVRALQSLQTRLSAKFQEIRENLPVKLLFFLVGFYCATAFATVIGQTGDWDILSAALAVLVVEGIGALMYRASLPLFDKIRGLVTMFNYWKAGLTLGLFLDSFKYEIENITRFADPFHFDILMLFRDLVFWIILP